MALPGRGPLARPGIQEVFGGQTCFTTSTTSSVSPSVRPLLIDLLVFQFSRFPRFRAHLCLCGWLDNGCTCCWLALPRPSLSPRQSSTSAPRRVFSGDLQGQPFILHMPVVCVSPNYAFGSTSCKSERCSSMDISLCTTASPWRPPATERASARQRSDPGRKVRANNPRCERNWEPTLVLCLFMAAWSQMVVSMSLFSSCFVSRSKQRSPLLTRQAHVSFPLGLTIEVMGLRSTV